MKSWTFLALLTAQAVILGLIELLFPAPFAAFPAIKLGLPNLITLVALSTCSFKQTCLIISGRLLLVTLLGGTISLLLYSTVGALLSLLAMASLKVVAKNKLSLIGISMAGAYFHLAGQLLMVTLMTQASTIFLSWPYFAGTSLLAGLVIGLLASLLLAQLAKLPHFTYLDKKASFRKGN